MDNVGLKLAIDIKRELEGLEEELKLIAVVFQFHAEVLIEDKVRRWINPSNEANDLFDEHGALLDRLRLESVDGSPRGRNQALIKGLGDADQSSFQRS